MAIELRPHQIKGIADISGVMEEFGIAYMNGEPRIGKTHIALSVAQLMGAKKVLFITTIMAMPGVKQQYDEGEYDFEITLVNNHYTKIAKISDKHDYDFIISDEHHSSCGAYPKPAKITVELKRIVGNTKFLMLSGTPNAETHIQLYFQFWVHQNSPWSKLKNFYYWFGCGYGFKKTKFIANQKQINDYSTANIPKILADVSKYMVIISQKDAGFEQTIDEKILRVDMTGKQIEMIKKLHVDKVIDLGDEKVILADSAVKAQSKMRQLFSGTVKYENGESEIVSTAKVDFIKQYFEGKKIAIYYEFIQEAKMLESAFPNFTRDQVVFNTSTDKVFISQFRSGREGVNLSTAYAIVAVNIAFSAVTYFQFKERMQYKGRTDAAKLFWIFSNGINGKKSIEDLVYETLTKKIPFTAKYYERNSHQLF